MTDIAVISTATTPLTTCPVFVTSGDDVDVCDAPLTVVLNRDVVGDDYGSWPTYNVGFACGHSLADMATSLRHADEI